MPSSQCRAGSSHVIVTLLKHEIPFNLFIFLTKKAYFTALQYQPTIYHTTENTNVFADECIVGYFVIFSEQNFGLKKRKKNGSHL